MPQGQIITCAVIGHEDNILLLRQPDGGWALPGAPVEPGEWIEDALHRGIRQVLGTGVSSACFLCLIEDPDGLFIVFDVILETDDALPTDPDPAQLAWVNLDQLASLNLQPVVLREVLRSGEPPAWLPHHIA